MPETPTPKRPRDDEPPPLSLIAILLRLGIIGLVSLLVTAAFLYAGGWLSPDRLTPVKVVDRFEQVDGISAGFRRNHAKGLCFAGVFQSNGQGLRVSRASVFDMGEVPVVGRFALAGGQPYLPDTPQMVRSMAVRFMPADGEDWRTGMNDIPVFPVSTPEAFYEQLAVFAPDPATGKPDPARMADFFARHPESAHAIELIKARAVSSGFHNDTFNSLDAFRFVDAEGKSVAVRWSMVPDAPFEAAAAAPGADKNYLFEDLIARIGQQPVQFHLVVTIGQPGDPTNDATVAWPPERERIDVGTLSIHAVEGEDVGACRDVNFDPLVLPAGIEPSDDPLLSARSAVYSRSFWRRAGESKDPSAVTTPAADKGA
ncbi:catalase family peroxidase [Hypericibacter adhaerens]|uniref:catalase family peroxidase n=1 Tax=Hypericibacter adhaerens TaxID=2602016 RepID=UPI002D802354|nr:catalase family peroxidase [Hypericibacter adhaerens]